MGNEIWQAIPSFPAYEASNQGRIRRVKGGRGAKIGRVLSQWDNGNGYLYCNINREGKSYKRRVHGLVAEAFLGECPDGYEVNHKDGIRVHNWADNLEYLTHAENCQHAVDVLERDPAAVGEEHPNAKLTRRKVKHIRRLRRQGRPLKEISQRFGVSEAVVSRVARGLAWKHI